LVLDDVLNSSGDRGSSSRGSSSFQITSAAVRNKISSINLDDKSSDKLPFDDKKPTKRSFGIKTGTSPTALELTPIISPLISGSRLTSCVDAHLEALVHNFLVAEGIHTGDWQATLLDLARKVAANLSPKLRYPGSTAGSSAKSDFFDIRKYLKIKTIPGGKISDSKYTAGYVFEKNRTHKKMKDSFKSPVVLLLSCDLAYHPATQNPIPAGSNQKQKESSIIPLEELHRNEEDYLRSLVDKFISYHPDVIFVEKNCARYAQEHLFEQGVCLFVNVKPKVMRILSRVCRAKLHQKIVTPTASSNHFFGTCGELHVKSFEIPPSSGEGVTNPKKQKTCLFVDGCPKELFATLVVRGTRDEALLKKIKKVLYHISYVAWHLHHTNLFLSSQHAALMEIPKVVLRPADGLPIFSPLLSYWNLSPQTSWVMPYYRRRPAVPDLITTSVAHHDLIDTSTEYDKNPLEIQFDFKSVLENTAAAELLLEEEAKNRIEQEHYDIESLAKHEHFLYLHALCCTTSSRLCIPHELHLIDFYSPNDMSLGEFLKRFCFDENFSCSADECGSDLIDHERSFIHHQGRINIFVKADELEEGGNPTAQSGDLCMWDKCPDGDEVSIEWRKLDEKATVEFLFWQVP